jgi:hypothetical protein
MCEKCDEIDVTLERYRRLKEQINDQKLHEAGARLIERLKAEKWALHPEP